MGGLFSLDNPIMRFLGKATDCIILSILWLICCIPIVTAGASTTAFYYTITKTIRNDRGYVMREFLHSFKTNFKQSTIMWFVMIAIVIFAYVDLYYAYMLSVTDIIPSVLFWFLVFLFVFVYIWMIYLLPYIARFTNTTKEVLKISFYMMIQNLFWSILNAIICVLGTVIVLMIPALVFVMAPVCMILLSISLERVFRKYMSEEDLRLENIRNGYKENESEEDEKGIAQF